MKIQLLFLMGRYTETSVSIKNAERLKRFSKQYSADILFNEEMLIIIKQESFLSIRKKLN